MKVKKVYKYQYMLLTFRDNPKIYYLYKRNQNTGIFKRIKHKDYLNNKERIWRPYPYLYDLREANDLYSPSYICKQLTKEDAFLKLL